MKKKRLNASARKNGLNVRPIENTYVNVICRPIDMSDRYYLEIINNDLINYKSIQPEESISNLLSSVYSRNLQVERIKKRSFWDLVVLYLSQLGQRESSVLSTFAKQRA